MLTRNFISNHVKLSILVAALLVAALAALTIPSTAVVAASCQTATGDITKTAGERFSTLTGDLDGTGTVVARTKTITSRSVIIRGTGTFPGTTTLFGGVPTKLPATFDITFVRVTTLDPAGEAVSFRGTARITSGTGAFLGALGATIRSSGTASGKPRPGGVGINGTYTATICIK